MLGNQLFNFVSGFEEDLNRLKRVDPVYTTCEIGKRRSVNHTRARSLASPSRGRGAAGGAWRRGTYVFVVECNKIINVVECNQRQ